MKIYFIPLYLLQLLEQLNYQKPGIYPSHEWFGTFKDNDKQEIWYFVYMLQANDIRWVEYQNNFLPYSSTKTYVGSNIWSFASQSNEHP